jgi:hypothetical protein
MVDLAWPNDLGAGKAVWQLFRMGADNWDEDRDPQLKAAHETIVEFTPDVTQVVRYEGDMGKASIEPMISRGIINEQGQLCTMNEDGTAGPVGVVLPATDSETITPRDWTYRATITKNRVRVREFSFPVPADAEVDLADYIEIEASGGTHIITEIETAERAEAAASDAERYRNETRTDRQAAQTARAGAETAETNAKGHSTSAGESASTAAGILEQVQDLGITVDNSVGTRVFVGDTMIYGRTGTRIVPLDGDRSGNVRISREGSLVSVSMSNVAQESAGNVITIPEGFRPSAAQYASTYWGNRSYIDIRGVTYLSYSGGGGDSVSFTYTTRDAWPETLPGTST